MRRASKSVEATTLDFSDFSGGLNLLAAPENIDQTELCDCNNMTYASAPGRLRSRKGLGTAIHTFAANISGMYWFNTGLMIASAGTLYRYASGAVGEVGALTGTAVPSWCEFGGDLFIASGGKLQKYTTAGALSTITDSKDNTIGLYAKFGRLYCWCSNSDYKYGSASGDASTWTIPANADASAPLEQQIGYKVAGNIVGCIPMLSDIIVFKDDSVLRVVEASASETTGIYEISRGEALANKCAVTNLGGELFYIDKSKGMRLLTGTDTYADILPSSTLIKVNQYIRDNLTDAKCRIWHLRGRKMIVVGLGGTICIPAYYDYGIDKMPALKWTFDDEIEDIVEPDRNSLYIAVGKSFYDFTQDIDVDCYFCPKQMVGNYNYLLKRVTMHANTYEDIPTYKAIQVLCNDMAIMTFHFGAIDSKALYNNTESIYGNDYPLVTYVTRVIEFTKHNTFRASKLKFKVTNNGGCPLEVSTFRVELVPVGVIA